MDNPQWFADNYPDVVNVQTYGDTKYFTVTPRVLPLVVPLHSLGLGFVADLIEPALRVFIEETGYDRSIPYGQPTPFRISPVFDPIKLTLDLIAAIPQGIQQALNGGPPPLVGPNGPITDSSTVSSSDSQALAGPTTTGVDALSKKSTPTSTLTVVKQDNQVDALDPDVEENSSLSGGSTQPTADEPESTADETKADATKADATKADTDTDKKDTTHKRADTDKTDTDKKADTDKKDADSAKAAA